MYRFLEATAAQYMTRAVTTVTRQTTMRELEALFEQRDFNSFPVEEEGRVLGSLQNSIFFEPLPLPLVRWCPITMS